MHITFWQLPHNSDLPQSLLPAKNGGTNKAIYVPPSSELPRIALVQLYQKDENTLTIRLAPEERFKRGDKWHGDMMEGESFDFHFYSSIFLTRKGLLNLFNHFNVRRGYSAQAQPIGA